MKSPTANLHWIDEIYATPDPWAEPTDTCPDQEFLWAAASAELPAEERRAILDHAMGCRYCTESWRLAMLLKGRSKMPIWAHFWAVLRADLRFLAGLPGRLVNLASTVPHRLASESGVLLPSALAAGLIAVVGLGAWMVRNDPASITRGGQALVSTAKGITLSVPRGEGLARDRFELSWSGPPGARYDVRIVTEQGRVVDSMQDLDRAEYRVPETKLAALPAGTILTWHVATEGDDVSLEVRLE